MVYDTKNKILHKGTFEKYRLTNQEHKLMVCLSTGNFVSYGEIGRYTGDLSSIKLVDDFKYRTKLNIQIRNGEVRLAEEIYYK